MQHLLHPSIPVEFIDYLLAAGYKLDSHARFIGTFSRDTCTVTISHERIIVETGFPPIADLVQVPGKKVCSFDGLQYLDFIGWVELMDLTGAVPIGETIGRVSRKEFSVLFKMLCQRIDAPAPGLELDIPTLSLNDNIN